MKKKLLISLVVCMLVVFAFALVANAEDTVCEHKYDKWTVELSSQGFLGDITASAPCTICKTVKTEIIPRLFITLGYSSSSNGVLQGYGVNRPAIERYEELSGEKVKFGGVIALQDTIGNKNPLDSKGEPINPYVRNYDYTETDINIINVAIKNIPDGYKASTKLLCALYVNAGGRTTYIDNCAEKVICGTKTFDEINDVPEVDTTVLDKSQVIEGKRYHQMTIDEMGLVAQKYWHKKVSTTTDDTSKKFFGTNAFERDDLPNGTIIYIENTEWQYRPEKWNINSSAERPLSTKAEYTVVDDNWWHDSNNVTYDLVGFNIAYYKNANPTENVGNLKVIINDYTVDDIAKIFKIFVPITYSDVIVDDGGEGGQTPPSGGEDGGETPPPSGGEDSGTTVIPPSTDYSDQKQNWQDDGVLKILAIGNSFSDDTMDHVYKVAKDAGVENIVLGKLYIGGCTLATHLANAQGDKRAYDYKVNTSGTWTAKGNQSIKYAVESDDWDFITFQQASGYSGIAETYDDLYELVNIVEPLNPSARLVWNMTWAYKVGSGHADFPKYNKDQMTMYNAIVQAVQTKILIYDKIEYVIPCGTAIQNLRTSVVGDTTRDGYHLSYGIGRYTAAMTLVKALTGLSIDNTVTLPDGVNSYYAMIAADCVNNAIKAPYSVTNSEYVSKKGGAGIDDSANVGTIPEGYVQLSSLQMGLTFASYYNSSGSNVWQKIEDKFARGFMATKKFTREELPVGTIIEIAVGWQYRPEGWKFAEGRPDNVTTLRIIVDEDWWGSYYERGFNISYVGHTSNNNIEIAMYTSDVAASIFKIYVPADVAPEVTKPEAPSYEYDYVKPETPVEPSDPTAGLVRVEYMDWLPLSYWNPTDGTNHSVRIDTASNSKSFWATRTFTKEQLPVGSVIIIESGAQYRLLGWNTFGAKGSRTDFITTNVIVVDEAWWGTHTVKAFNIANSSTSSLVGVTEEQINNWFKIYVPESAIELNKAPTTPENPGTTPTPDPETPVEPETPETPDDTMVYVKSSDCVSDVTVINGKEYRALTQEAMGLIKNAYYFSTNTGAKIHESGTSGTPASYFATKLFYKNTLPNGAVIWVNSGWKYRPEGWIDENTKNNGEGDGNRQRPKNVSTTYVTIDEAWWRTFTIRGFNISKGSSLVGTSADTVYENFKIYIPVENIID